MTTPSLEAPIQTHAAIRRPKRVPTLKRKLVFSALTILLVGVAGSFVVCGYYTYKAYSFHNQIMRSMKWEGDSCLRDDPELGFALRENVFMRQRKPVSFDLYTDDRGGRVDRPGCAAPQKIDVLTVGCSFTYGHGVEDHETYAKVIGRQTGLEVYNVGMASYGTVASLLNMKRYADLQPRVIVYGYIDDHKRRSLCPTAPTFCPFLLPVPFVGFDADDQPILYSPVSNTDLHEQYLTDVVMEHSFGAKDVSWAMYIDFLRLFRRQSPPYLGVTDEDVLKKIEQSYVSLNDPARVQKMLNFLIAEMGKQARGMQAKLIIAYLPYRSLQPLPPDLVEAVEAANMPDTLILVDTCPAVSELVDQEGLDAAFIRDDSHPAAGGHARIAEAIEPVVKRLLQ